MKMSKTESKQSKPQQSIKEQPSVEEIISPGRKPIAKEEALRQFVSQDLFNSITRVEEAAKHLVSVTGITTGLIAAAKTFTLKVVKEGIQIGEQDAGFTWSLGFLLLSLFLALLVLMPFPYKSKQNVPVSIEAYLLKARRNKIIILYLAFGCLVTGIIIGVYYP
jgi:hypothetical protein